MIVIADDLTGTNDTAIQFVKKGYTVLVKPLWKEKQHFVYKENANVIAINSESRALEPKEASKRIKKIVESFSEPASEKWYKKIDSMLRGNPAEELDALLSVLTDSIAFVTPAFPSVGRIVKDAKLLASETEVDIIKIFEKGTSLKISKITVAELKQNRNLLIKHIKKEIEKKTRIFIFDALDENDLRAINEISQDFSSVILCGSAGLASQMEAIKIDNSIQYNKFSQGTILTVIGSRHTRTKDQIEAVKNHFNAKLILVDTDICIKNSRSAVENCIEQIDEQISKGNKCLFLVVNSLFKPYKFALREKKSDYIEAEIISNTLAEICEEIIKKHTFSAFITAGGDTSSQLCSICNTEGVTIINEIEAGVPVGIMEGGKTDKTLIITKSGGFGSDEVFIKAIEFVQGE